MAERIGAFKTPEARDAYADVYDRVLEREWPVHHEELEVGTRFGTTRVRRSDGGDATPLVMVHPTTGSSLGWYPIVEPLCRDRVVYTPDTIGTCGRSVQTEPIESDRDLTLWLDEVLDQLEVERIHLLGYSEGGWIVGSHAAHTTRKDRLASLTLVEPAGAIERVPPLFLVTMIGRAMLAMASRDRTAALSRFSRWLNGDLELTEAQVELLEVSMGTFRQRLPTPGRLDDDEVRAIPAPVLLMIGEDTRIYDPVKVVDRARRLIPDVTIDTTANAGHGLLFQHPEALTGRINDFLAMHDGA